MTPWVFVNIGSCNDLLPDGIKLLPDTMLTYRYDPVELKVTPLKMFNSVGSDYLNQWLFYWRIYASLGLNELRDDDEDTILLNATICYN